MTFSVSKVALRICFFNVFIDRAGELEYYRVNVQLTKSKLQFAAKPNKRAVDGRRFCVDLSIRRVIYCCLIGKVDNSFLKLMYIFLMIYFNVTEQEVH